MKYIYLEYKLYKYRQVNIFKIYTVMCMYLYIHNKYTKNTHVYYTNKNAILYAINRD